MDINKLLEMQAELDRYIEEENGLKDQGLIPKKVLALLVEIGELANETRAFKFWSKKPASEKQVILEEFVDGLHFILSLGLEIGIKQINLKETNFTVEDVTEQFLIIYRSIHDFQMSYSVSEYQSLLNQYFYLGELLGFSHSDVVNAYFNKNEVNYQRQQEGY
ncbi:dimeric dUTPase (all-alpha-NTP-PPase superfamily) [Bacillus pakistanensis]|uniref:Dimeric dUTPase (All-alpha-NTP-PPase superfamily) n=1 Tax=Rossellomorea pakistanensis TaxID=992288 RepID=A0ABS2NAL2_9BACI|nr:dimeric dUTPase (all-alpha-NTP-PPase superfamily) [Bacillus pakistanensis]